MHVVNIHVLSNERIFTVKYPELFIKARGHNLESCIKVKDIDFFSEISDLKYVPLDLAESYFELNHLVLTNILRDVDPLKEKSLITKNNAIKILNKAFEIPKRIMNDGILGYMENFHYIELFFECKKLNTQNCVWEFLRRDLKIFLEDYFDNLDCILKNIEKSTSPKELHDDLIMTFSRTEILTKFKNLKAEIRNYLKYNINKYHASELSSLTRYFKEIGQDVDDLTIKYNEKTFAYDYQTDKGVIIDGKNQKIISHKLIEELDDELFQKMKEYRMKRKDFFLELELLFINN